MLPKINTPTYLITMPGGNELKVRQLLAGEYKILLDALVRGDDSTIALSVGDVISRCVLDSDFDFAHLNITDVEYLFMQIYKYGVNSNVNIQMTCHKCETTFGIPIPVDDIKLTEGIADVVTVDNIVIKLKQPKWVEWYQLEDKSVDSSVLMQVVDQIWQGENCFTAYTDTSKPIDPETQFTAEELEQWADGLPAETVDHIVKFIRQTPTLQWQKEIICPSCGNKETVTLTGLDDFFG